MFTQAKKTNISRCFGCPIACKLSIKEIIVAEKLTEEHITENTISFITPDFNYIPQINGKDITEFTDINNEYYLKTTCRTYEQALELLRNQILPACDNYKNHR